MSLPILLFLYDLQNLTKHFISLENILLECSVFHYKLEPVLLNQLHDSRRLSECMIVIGHCSASLSTIQNKAVSIHCTGYKLCLTMDAIHLFVIELPQ